MRGALSNVWEVLGILFRANGNGMSGASESTLIYRSSFRLSSKQLGKWVLSQFAQCFKGYSGVSLRLVKPCAHHQCYCRAACDLNGSPPRSWLTGEIYAWACAFAINRPRQHQCSGNTCWQMAVPIALILLGSLFKLAHGASDTVWVRNC
jgi:hypothetical protein